MAKVTLALERGNMMSSGASKASRILVVDDEDAIRHVLSKYLRSRGFEVVAAGSAEAALKVLAGARFDIMLCDVRLPGLSGVELVPEALQTDPDLGIVMLSAVNDAPTATEAMSHGVLDYLTKPIELEHLYAAVNRALHKRTLLSEQRRIERKIREEVAERTREVELEKSHLHDLTIEVVEMLVNVMETKDGFQRGHAARVAELAASIAEFMRLSPDVVEDVRMAARLHDIGNIGIREDVLNKPGPLNADEFAHIKDHVRLSVEILTPMRHIERAVVFVADHHEHWDGSGYPNALSGSHISIGGRILAAADAFDALTSKRAYREPTTPEAAVDDLRRSVGTLLDPQVYQGLHAVVMRRKSLVFIDALHA